MTLCVTSVNIKCGKGLFINHVIGLIDVWVKENIMKHHVDGVWGVLININIHVKSKEIKRYRAEISSILA